LQPTWIDMARSVPQLAPFLRVSTRAADALRAGLGTFSTQTYRHASDETLALEIARFSDQPSFGLWTYATLGLSNTKWRELGRPRIELVLATSIDTEVCGQILANLAFHLAETGFFPEPGVMVRDVIGALGVGDLSQRLPHIYVMVPWLWRLELPIDEGPPPITLARVVPVSEAEYLLWRNHAGGFEKVLTDSKVELADLERRG
jgi:hypothetical protein